MNDIELLIDQCKKNDRVAQKKLYEKFSVRLMGICLRYTKSRVEAEDLLQEVFIKIFKKIKDFKGDGVFEGWICRITVNTAITYYHKTKQLKDNVNVDDYAEQIFEYEKITDILSTKELLELINRLPDIYKVVFNLYVIEGYSHKEIAEMLKISEGTSKSQLSRSRKHLQKMLLELNNLNDETRIIK